MIKAVKTGGGRGEVTWDGRADDPRGWLAKAWELGHVQDALAALADPMEFARVAADDEGAREQLRSVAWLVDQLARRQDALIVALKDRRAASWTELVLLVDPDEPDPLSKRSAMQRRYSTGRRRAGLPAPGDTPRWPDKPVTEFTDAELADAIERHESDPDPVTHDLVRSCIHEWERRKGLPTT